MMENKTWYRVSRYEQQISEIQVVRETKACIYINDLFGKGQRKILKSNSYESYFETLEQAQEKFKEIQETRQKQQKNDRIRCKSKIMYDLIKSMSEHDIGTSDIAAMKQIVADVEK